MPLILHGLRQAGKTYSSLSFGKDQYKNTAYFNFEDNTEIAGIFERDLNPERIVLSLSAKSGHTILKNDTLIIFDEIQACERALSSLKYFCENAPEYHIIATGSHLGIAVNRERYSFPVGKVDMLTLYPLDFEEFLWALGKIDMAELIRSAFETNEYLPLHESAMELLRTYLVTGGMPRAVLEYVEKQDFNFVQAAQKNINDSYIADMARYATPIETAKILAAFNSIPAQLAKDNHKFQYRVIRRGARAHEYETPVDWLAASGVIIKCNKVNESRMPLTAYSDASSFKVYMTDTGLLCSKLSLPPHFVLTDMQGIADFKGALIENYVCSALVTNRYVPFYWESRGKAEVDFIIQSHDGSIIPVEVKSGDNVRAKSLAHYINRYAPVYSLRISAKNFGFENKIKSVPLYAVFCL
ncbi:MAG: ATP-binding protein [Vulcanimicrobiota bacterium]